MRIAIVTATFPPYHGGMGAAAHDEAAVFVRLGHEVMVFAPGDASADKNLPYHVCRLRPLFRIGNGAVLPQLMWQLRGFDLVVLHYPAFGLLTPVFLWRLLFGLRKKFVVMYHMDPLATGVRGCIFKFSEMTIARLLLQSTDKILVSTLDYANHGSLARFGSSVLEKCEEIPFAVDTEFFSPGSDDEKKVFQTKYTSKNVLFVGGMDTAHDFKGVPELLRAWSVAEIKDATLHLVGDGDCRSAYEKLAESLGLQSRIFFHGGASKDVVKTLLQSVDLLVLPSKTRSEAFGIVLLEAMACGTPVVASNLPGVRTVVTQNETGWLTKPGDVEELASVLRDALGDVKRFSRMGEQARERVLAEYSQQKFQDRNAVFLEMLFPKRTKAKMLIVSSLFLPESRGGAELVAYRMAQMLQKAGHEIVVVASAAKNQPRYSEEKRGDLKIIRYRPRHVGDLRDLSRYSFLRRVAWHLVDAVNVSSALRFRKILKAQNPDVVVTHGLKGLGYLLPRTIRSCGVRHIHVLHDVQLIEPSGIAEPEVKKTLFRRVWSLKTCALFGSPSAVVFPSQWLLDLSRQWGFFRKSVCLHLPNPLQRQAVTHARPIKTFLFLGQLESHKGIQDVLAAMELVDKECMLLVVADGSLKALVEDTAKKNPRIHYLGRREGAALADAWSLADCMIVPSRCAENAPNVIQEAIAHGLLVIATRVGGIPEMVEEGVTGYLVPPGDVDRLQKHMSALLGTMVSDETRLRMKTKAATWEDGEYVTRFEELMGAIVGFDQIVK